MIYIKNRTTGTVRVVSFLAFNELKRDTGGEREKM